MHWVPARGAERDDSGSADVRVKRVHHRGGRPRHSLTRGRDGQLLGNRLCRTDFRQPQRGSVARRSSSSADSAAAERSAHRCRIMRFGATRGPEVARSQFPRSTARTIPDIIDQQSSVKACRLSLLRRLFNGPRRKNLISFATGHYSPAISFSGTAASANAVGEILAPSTTSLRPCT